MLAYYLHDLYGKYLHTQRFGESIRVYGHFDWWAAARIKFNKYARYLFQDYLPCAKRDADDRHMHFGSVQSSRWFVFADKRPESSVAKMIGRVDRLRSSVRTAAERSLRPGRSWKQSQKCSSWNDEVTICFVN